MCEGVKVVSFFRMQEITRYFRSVLITHMIVRAALDCSPTNLRFLFIPQTAALAMR